MIEVHVWKVRLDRRASLDSTPAELAHAERLATPVLRLRYLRAHAALRDILGRYTAAPLEFARHPRGKPYLASDDAVRFNLAHSRGMALVAVARGREIGVDLERLRPLPDYGAIARRYFPADTPAPVNVRDFFGQWTRFEALLKAQGTGLFAIGEAPPGEWSVTAIEAGPRFAAALAAQGDPPAIEFHEYPIKEN
ncbi:MAG: 4'-phosphopantetheinyl transferase superfamily protein [Candidatus Solibacter sp.]